MAKTKTTKKQNNQKKTTKKKSNSKNTKKPILYYINRIIIFFIILIITFFIYEIFIKDDIHKISNELTTKPNTNATIVKHKKVFKEISKEFEEKTEELSVEYVNNEKEIEHKIIQPKQEEILTNVSVFDISKKTPEIKKEIVSVEIKNTKPKSKEIVKNTKPMLVIMIDDVSNKKQVKKIQNISYPITMSFLPPASNHKHSASIAKNIKVHMIHLPLEASTRSFEEENTLHVGDSLAKIDARIKELRKLYPNTLYTNNHTGSKFTKDDVSMDRLTKTLKKYGYFYIDSRTTSKTVIKKYATKYNLPYLSRNIFIDNIQDTQYIINQLKKAIKIAKKKGYAIAIGHPHKITLQTLKDVKYLFKDVQLVNIDTLAKR